MYMACDSNNWAELIILKAKRIGSMIKFLMVINFTLSITQYYVLCTVGSRALSCPAQLSELSILVSAL